MVATIKCITAYNLILCVEIEYSIQFHRMTYSRDIVAMS